MENVAWGDEDRYGIGVVYQKIWKIKTVLLS